MLLNTPIWQKSLGTLIDLVFILLYWVLDSCSSEQLFLDQDFLFGWGKSGQDDRSNQYGQPSRPSGSSNRPTIGR